MPTMIYEGIELRSKWGYAFLIPNTIKLFYANDYKIAKEEMSKEIAEFENYLFLKETMGFGIYEANFDDTGTIFRAGKLLYYAIGFTSQDTYHMSGAEAALWAGQAKAGLIASEMEGYNPTP
jgi:hypothetical protein